MPTRNKFYYDASGALSPVNLQIIGPLLQVAISVPTVLAQRLGEEGSTLPNPIAGWALIDTGASRTCVHEQVLMDLGLQPMGLVTTGTAGGKVQRTLYAAKIDFPEDGFEIEFSSVVSVDLTGQAIPVTKEKGAQQLLVLVGRDILTRVVLTYNGPGGFITFSY